MLIIENGMIELLHSTFQKNIAEEHFAIQFANFTLFEGLRGIVNLCGEVWCHRTDGCEQDCTACLSQSPAPQPTIAGVVVVPSFPPTLQPTDEKVAILCRPTLHPTVTTTGSKQHRRQSRSQGIAGWSVAAGLASVLGLVVVLWRRRMLCCVRLNSGLREEERVVEPLLQLGDAPESESVELRMLRSSQSGSVDLATRSAVLKSYEGSPAPVFVVARNSMRVMLWSPGMEMAMGASMVRSPVGCLLSELPFVNHADGDRLHRALVRSFDSLDENDEARTFMLHLRTQGMVVLLEMVATQLFATESVPIIVFTGRQVDPDSPAARRLFLSS